MKKLRASRLLSLLFFTCSLAAPSVKAASSLKTILTFSVLLFSKVAQSSFYEDKFSGLGSSLQEGLAAIEGSGFSNAPMTALDKLEYACGDIDVFYDGINNELGGALGNFPLQRVNEECGDVLSMTNAPTMEPTTYGPTTATTEPTTVSPTSLTVSPTVNSPLSNGGDDDNDKKFVETPGFIVLVTLGSIAGLKFIVATCLCMSKRGCCNERYKDCATRVSDTCFAPCWDDAICKVLCCSYCCDKCNTCRKCWDCFTCGLCTLYCVPFFSETPECCKQFFCAEHCCKEESQRAKDIELQVSSSAHS